MSDGPQTLCLERARARYSCCMEDQVLEKHTLLVRTQVSHYSIGADRSNTATECIAQYTKRPLLSLTTADIGVDPSSAERSLNFYFNRAKLWDAVLLIDEADIFMERRETMDLGRNSLVSG